MGTVAFGEEAAKRFAALKEKQGSMLDGIKPFEPVIEPIQVRPTAKNWDALEKILQQVINFDGLWITARSLYEKGYGAELETAAEIAVAIKRDKHPYRLFASMISKASGNWEKKTLEFVRQTWEVRRNAVMVMEKLALKTDSAKAILATAWRLKGGIVRCLAMATEQGTGIKSPVAVFFALTKKRSAATT